MKRNLITINEDLCIGCGKCVSACSEGALVIINGKAKLVKEEYCDGLGDCIGECPTGALVIKEVEAKPFASKYTETNQVPASCPGLMSKMNVSEKQTEPAPTKGAGSGQAIRSDLSHWPVQLHLVRPGAPFFNNKELLVLSSCAPVASADVHWRFIRGRAVAIACPKLDNTEGYVEKLAEIMKDPSIPSVIVVRMEVPCCGRLPMMVKQAVELSGRTDIRMEEVTVGLTGDIL
ncbi:MAG: 4Fe-4S binding protein [Lentisphaerae bacterium]|nr:4Fe-4S binding protein [Lentisphaerota bacterium]